MLLGERWLVQATGEHFTAGHRGILYPSRLLSSHTHTCNPKLSGEHLISEGALKVLAEKQVEVSGFSWLKGEKKILGFAALKGNILCRAHNSALSPIDAIGARFFSAIQKCGTSIDGSHLSFLFSGHDVERWLLRTVAALAVSKNFSIDGAQLDDGLVSRLKLSELLENPRHHFDPDAATAEANAMIARRRVLAGTGYLFGLAAAAPAVAGTSALKILTNSGNGTMEIKRIGSQPSSLGSTDYFTGTVRIDPLFEAPDPARRPRCV
jgi:hypothetical protein